METFQIHHTTLDVLLAEPQTSQGKKDESFLAGALGATGSSAGQSHDKSTHQLELGYRVALATASAKRLESLAFQGLDTQTCGCSVQEAANAAVGAVQEFLKQNPNTSLRRVLFIQYSRDTYDAICSALKNTAS